MTLDKNHDMFLAAFFNLLRGRMYTSSIGIFFSGYRCNKTRYTEFKFLNCYVKMKLNLKVLR